MGRLEAAWNRFWLGEVDGLSLGLVRVGFAASRVPLVLVWYSVRRIEALRLELRRLIAAR